MSFDIILLLDVLEHTVDPLSFLAAASARLAPNGHMLISVPNVAHWAIRLTLLTGNFGPYERGALDGTHLHHFTRAKLLELFATRKELEIVRQAGSISPAEHVLPDTLTTTWAFALFSRLRHAGAQWMPGLLAYQHLAHLRKKG